MSGVKATNSRISSRPSSRPSSASPKAQDAAPVKLGQYVSVVSYEGTVRYVGKTSFAPGAWVGIELSEAVGKNDGSVQGTKYFECPPNHGIFVRQGVPKVIEKPAAAAKVAKKSGSVAFDNDSSDSDSGEDMPVVVRKTTSVRRLGVSAEAAKQAASDWKPPVYEKAAVERQQLCNIIRTSKDSKLQMMFGNMTPETFEKIIDAMFLKAVAKGEDVITEGDVGDYFYIVKSGHFDIFQTRDEQAQKVKVFEASAGFAFGELALLYNAPRAATVTATEKSEVWCLERMAFRVLVVQASEERFKENVAFLRRCDIFAELDAEETAALAEVLLEEDFEGDEAILEQGDKDNNMFILRKGEAVACIKGDQGEVEVMKYNQGDYFGEIALLLGEPRKASVYAVGNVTCLYISRDTFNRILGPLRDFLQRNIGKYQRYQEAITAGPIKESTRQGGMEDPKAATGGGNTEVFEGAAPVRHRISTRKRDRAITIEPGTANKGEDEGVSLKEKVAEDFKNPALVTVSDKLVVQNASVQVFGGLRLGEKFTLDKSVVVRTQTNPVTEGTEDIYTWKASTWLKGSTHVAVLCQKGQKSAADPTPNQDNYFILHVGPVQVYGVADGHGPFGHLVSFRLVQALPHFLKKSEHWGKDWKSALREAFLKAQEDLLDLCTQHDVNTEASGAAGTVLVFDGPRIHVAHIGDAGAMVASWNRHDSRLVYGTKDHKPEVPEERARLEGAGSEVRQVDETSSRIYIRGTTFPGLTMSRAFGDTACAGVLQEPEYKEIMLQPSDEYYAIIASDGIWEFIEYDKALELSAKKLRLKGPRETARFMVEASRKRWSYCCGEYCDDITAIVVQWNVSEKSTDTNHSLIVRRHE